MWYMILQEYLDNPFLFQSRLIRYFETIEKYKVGSYLRGGVMIPKKWVRNVKKQPERTLELLPEKEIEFIKPRRMRKELGYEVFTAQKLVVGDVIWVDTKWRTIRSIDLHKQKNNDTYHIVFKDGTTRKCRAKAITGYRTKPR